VWTGNGRGMKLNMAQSCVAFHPLLLSEVVLVPNLMQLSNMHPLEKKQTNKSIYDAQSDDLQIAENFHSLCNYKICIIEYL
jgi:hypothetical protein